MNNLPSIEVSLEDLSLAYRKAKVDLFYSSRACREDLLKFEERLSQNLSKLKEKLASGKSAWSFSDDDWSVIPAGFSKLPDAESNPFLFSDPNAEWKQLKNRGGEDNKPTAVLRVMETLPIDFHILAALWTSTAGAKFEERLSPQACGNRLRRNKENQFNRLSLGSCRHYFTPYRSWRDDAVRAMGAALDENKSIVAVTADVSAFYHRISPKFILNPSFHKLLKVQLTAEEDALNRLFIHYLLDWAEVASPLPGGNLPVGLTASSVIANLALWELDQIISQEIVPRYYGRYVDDIILVVENVKDFTRSTDVWDWLVKRSGGAITVEGEEVHFKRDYLEDCTITFKNSKNKV